MKREELRDLARAAFGLGESDSFQEVVAEPIPPSRAGHGLMTTEEDEPFDDRLVDRAIASGNFDTLEKLPQDPFRFRVRRWADQPGILFLEYAEDLLPVRGLWRRLQPGAYAVDTRSRPAFFFLASGDRDYALSLCQGDVFLDQVMRTRSGSLGKMASWRPPAFTEVVLPGIGELLKGEPCADWLENEAGLLECSPSIVDRLAALGMLVRLWSPPPGGRAAEIVRGILENRTPTLSARVRGALADIAPVFLREVEHLAVLETDVLGDRLEALHDAVAVEDAQAPSLLNSLVLRRDDLESVAVVLRLGEAGEQLGDALDGLDRRARHSLYAFSLLPAPADSDRLRTVAWKEPLAWWASLAGS